MDFNENADLFVCNKCGSWFANLDIFEKHCFENMCTKLYDQKTIEERRKISEREARILLYIINGNMIKSQPSTSNNNDDETQSPIGDGNAQASTSVVDSPPIELNQCVLVCGGCEKIFNRIDEFKQHRLPSGACADDK